MLLAKALFPHSALSATQHQPAGSDSLLVYVLLSSSQELQNNTLAEKPENITVSPR